MDIETKKNVWKKCVSGIEKQLKRLQESMDRAQKEANLETKSSAGDKYETNRSMMQLEKERYAIQHQRVQKMYNTLLRIDCSKEFLTVQVGALVHTSIGWFFLSVGLGKIEWKEQWIQCISIDTPIGKVLEGYEEGDIVDFRDKEIEIIGVI